MISNIDMWASMSFNNSKLNKVCADDQGEQSINTAGERYSMKEVGESSMVTPNLLVLGSIYKSYNGATNKN